MEGRPELIDALLVLWRSKWSILIITAVTTGLALFLSNRQTPIYQSDAEVLVTPVQLQGTSETAIAPNMLTEAKVASSAAVAEVVKETLGSTIPSGSLLGAVSVDNPPATEILHFSYRDADPATAQRMAQGFADAYLEYRKRTISGARLDEATTIDAELKQLRERFNVVESLLARLASTDPRVGSLQSEAAVLQSLILQRQLDRLRLSERVSPGTVVQPAGLPSSPASPNHVVNAAFGLFAGLGLGIALAFMRERLAGRLRSSGDIEASLGAPVLGSIPQVPAWRKRKEAFLITRTDWPSPASEAYRTLRTNVLSTASAIGVKSIVVTSARSGEGKSATVANLGVVLARTGKRVVIVSADLRRPRVQEFFGVRTRAGLVDVLTGKQSVEQCLQDVKLPKSPGTDPAATSLRILASGRVPENPAELVGSDAMVRILRGLEDDADVVLIDVPPLLPVSDALVVAPMVQGVLFVIGPRSATSSTVTSAREQLDKVNARILGAVLNGPDPHLAQTYSSY